MIMGLSNFGKCQNIFGDRISLNRIGIEIMYPL